MYLAAEAGAAIFNNNYTKIVGQGIKSRRQNTPVGGDTAKDDRVDSVKPERLVEISLIKGAEAPLGRVNVRFHLGQQSGYFSTFCSPDGVVFHFTLEDEISRQKAVHGKDYGNGVSPGKVSQAVDGRYDGSARFFDGHGGSAFQSIFEHIDDYNGRFHEILLMICS